MILEYLPVILMTALCTVILTLTTGVFALKWFLASMIQKEAEEILAQFERRLRESMEGAASELVPEFRRELEAGFKDTAEEMLPDFREELKNGFHEAGTELLPELRAEVREGFKDAVKDVVSGELVPEAASSMAKKGTNIVNSGLNILFGKKET